MTKITNKQSSNKKKFLQISDDTLDLIIVLSLTISSLCVIIMTLISKQIWIMISGIILITACFAAIIRSHQLPKDKD